MVVEAVDPRTRLKGLRVQVRDPENRSRQEGSSFIDIEEVARGSPAGLTAMAELAAKINTRRSAGNGAYLYDRRRLPARDSPFGPHPQGFPFHRPAGSGGRVNRDCGAPDPQAGVRSGARDTQQQVTSRFSRGP